MSASHERPRTASSAAAPRARRQVGSPTSASTCSWSDPGTVGVEEQAGAAVVDEVERTAAGRCDDGHPESGGLLERLSEGLAGAGVHEDVERGIRAGQVGTALATEEERVSGSGGPAWRPPPR